ncbi:MAG: ABC transporter ATP-binding protein [bacterium]
MAAAVAIDNFSFRYFTGAAPALKNISLTLHENSLCVILGPTNAGKTTLIQAISGVLGKHHSTGSATGLMIINGSSYVPLPKELQFPSVGLVLQDPFVQISGMASTVFEEICFTLQNLGTPKEQIDIRVRETMNLLGIAHLAHRRPTELSGGETQRVALASVLVAEPSIILLDEPVTAIDSGGQAHLRAVLKALHNSSTIIVTDTALEFSFGIADRYVVLAGGEMVFEGTKDQFFTRLGEFSEFLPVEKWQYLATRINATGSHSSKSERIRRFFQ